jgi:hypothetical protein
MFTEKNREVTLIGEILSVRIRVNPWLIVFPN